jgi:hypothetical protein
MRSLEGGFVEDLYSFGRDLSQSLSLIGFSNYNLRIYCKMAADGKP